MPPDRTVQRILVVDDDEDLLDFIARLLRRPGREVLLASSHGAARRLVALYPFALVVSDLRLGGDDGDADGLDLLAFVREHVPTTQTVLLTGDACSAVRRRAATLGVGAVLAKPFNALQLAADVLTLLGDG